MMSCQDSTSSSSSSNDWSLEEEENMNNMYELHSLIPLSHSFALCTFDLSFSPFRPLLSPHSFSSFSALIILVFFQPVPF